jgi:predicted ribosome quality control (RQC) complex YloA/Tae2 family protein
MQPQDTTTLRGVVSELKAELVPSRFEKAQQAESGGVQLAFRTLKQRLWLALYWQADCPRFHAIEPPPRLGEGSTLAQQLQYGLKGLALVRLEQLPWERVVQLGFAPRPDAPEQRQLVLELMGRHSNLFLLDERQQVISSGRQVREHQSRLRPISTGDAYTPPPPLQGAEPQRQESLERWRERLCLLPESIGRALMGSYRGISPALRDQLLQQAGLERNNSVKALTPEQWQQLFGSWQRWLEDVERNTLHFSCTGVGYRCWGEPAKAQGERPLALNLALASYYGQGLRQAQCQQQRQRLEQQLQQFIQREQRELQRQQQLLARTDDEHQLQRQADLLLCRSDVTSTGHQQLELHDPETDQTVVVTLDPQLNLVSQAQKLYQRARKLRRSVAAIAPRLRWHQQRLELLEASQVQLQLADSNDSEVLEALADDLEPFLQTKQNIRNNSRRQQGTPCPLVLQSPSGIPLLVGRNHRQNDWISFRQARRGDLWFHAQEQPGSHVVLKGSEGEISDTDLQTAADLAAHFSRSRGNKKVPVVMVPTEQLQRIPGMGPGLVRHGSGSVLWGEPDRAESLLPSLQP